MDIISVRHLNFEYDGRRILHDMSFTVKEGTITALVGPNGAGKTTLMRCLAALETPLTGDIVICGLATAGDPRAVHRVTGYLSDNFGLYEGLNVRQCLVYMAWCYGLRGADVDARVTHVAEIAGLSGHLEHKTETLSRGWRQRVGIAIALLNNPKLLLLDEPASGLDPEARVELSSLLCRLRDGGMTIMVSSHILAELEDYSTAMIVVRDGRIVDHIALHQEHSQLKSVVEIEISGGAQDHENFIAAYQGVDAVQCRDDFLRFDMAGDDTARNELLKDLLARGAVIRSFGVQKSRMQHAYMDIAQRSAIAKAEG